MSEKTRSRDSFSFGLWQWIGGALLLMASIGTWTDSLNHIGSIGSGVVGLLLLPPIWERFQVNKWLALGLFVVGLTAWRTTQSIDNQSPLREAAEQAKADSADVVNERNLKVSNDIDISNLKAARAIKRQLKDPDSYEEIEHRAGTAQAPGVYISCEVKYRAKNSFGGYGVEIARVDFDSTMQPIRVVSK